MEPEETIVKCNKSGIEKQMLRFHSSFLFVTNEPGTFYAAKYDLVPPTSISYVLGLQVCITVDVPGLSPRGSQMTTLWLVMASTLPAELHSASFGNLINTALRSLHIVIHGPQLCWRFQSMYSHQWPLAISLLLLAHVVTFPHIAVALYLLTSGASTQMCGLLLCDQAGSWHFPHQDPMSFKRTWIHVSGPWLLRFVKFFSYLISICPLGECLVSPRTLMQTLKTFAYLCLFNVSPPCF